MISGGIEINWFTKFIRPILEAEFVDEFDVPESKSFRSTKT